MQRIAGRIALVTGGAAGLGNAIARRFVAEGARVVISDVQVELGRRAAQEAGMAFLEHDVTCEAQWSRVIQSIEATHGPLDVLVNNAGVVGSTQNASPESTSLEDWRRVFAVNVDGAFLGCRAAIASMRKAGGGSIVNIASIAGLLATPYATAYGATKAAVRQLTKSVAEHCAREKLNVRCNSIHPGIVPTALWMKHAQEFAKHSDITLDEVIEDAKGRNPMGSLTTPEDVAAACVFLVSDEARHVNGIKLVVDGGVVACRTFQRDGKAG